MKFEQIKNPTKKLAKGFAGILAIKLAILAVILIVQSCKKDDLPQSKNQLKAKENFLKALEFHKNSISLISSKSIRNGDLKMATQNTQYSYDSDGQYQAVYLDFPSTVSDEASSSIYGTTSIEGLSNLINEYDATLQYDPTISNSNYQFNIPIENLVNSLQPLVSESKNYLYSKGFTNSDIQNMIVEEGGTEEDLIPFVMSLTQIESNQQNANNYSSLFLNSAYADGLDANDYIRCGIVAIGVDVGWALMGSNASTWSIALMSKAFGAVAKRLLGPIGVAIAVVSFGVCIAEAYYD